MRASFDYLPVFCITESNVLFMEATMLKIGLVSVCLVAAVVCVIKRKYWQASVAVALEIIAALAM
jgi:hypothetical protein